VFVYFGGIGTTIIIDEALKDFTMTPGFGLGLL
jgi:hypothetical protein